jgi:hypothetical protein
MRRREDSHVPNPSYFLNQPHITPLYRTIVLNWLVDVHKNLKMHTDTLFTAVELIDLYFSRVTIQRHRFQVACCAALFLASKSDDHRAPPVSQFLFVTGNSFSGSDLRDMEAEIFRTLDCQVSVVHASHFLKRFLRFPAPSTRLTMLAHFINESAILDLNLIGACPSLRAAAVIALAQAIDRGIYEWKEEMVSLTSYTVKEIQPFVNQLLATVRRFARSKYDAIRRKYAVESLACVSLIEFPDSVQLK